MSRTDLIPGDRFGRLTVISLAPKRLRHTEWHCRCDCGEMKTTRASTLRAGRTRSCGCLGREELRTRRGNLRHGQRWTIEYRIWSGMKSRCYNPKNKSYANYGGRGIRVCDRWLNSFEDFLADVGRRPSPAHSIDRYPDNDGDYRPGNVRWATAAQQAANKRNSIKPTAKARICALRKLGFSHREIADSVGCDRRSVGRAITAAITRDIR
jgi:hypothetical protein